MRRQLRYGGNAVLYGAIVLGILASGNYLVYRHDRRWDLTKNKRYSLSDQSKKVLQNLKQDVKITYFAKGADMTYAQERLKQYQAASPHVKAEFVDALKDPAKARELGVTTAPTLILERGTRQEKISADSEQDVTNALIKVTRDVKKTVCFATGEGEKDPEDSGERGYSGLKAGLAASGYAVKTTLLLREGKVPADCSVLLLSGPEKDPLPPVIDAVRDFVKAGGRTVVMIDPEFKESYPHVTGLLKEWNIEAGNDLVVDASLKSQLAGAGLETPLAANYPSHEITRDFRLATAFHTARSVQPGKGTPEGVFAQSLVETSEASWAQTDLKAVHVQGPQKTDRMGPISLAAVATIRPPAPTPGPSPSPSPAAEEAPKPPEGRAVVFGDSDFASNMLLHLPGNRDLVLNTVAWLTEQADLISIRPKEPDDQRMFLTGMQYRNVLILSLVLIPGFFVVLGVSTWWRRR